MKNLKILSEMMLTTVIAFTMMACSGDDEKKSSTEGVNVISGKKLVELKVSDSQNDHPSTYKVLYDSKGRIRSILQERWDKDYNSNTWYPTGEGSSLVTIDYELNTIKFSRKSKTYNFSLNENGYINRIGTCVLNYDSNGYLIGVDESNEINTLIYDSNNIAKASITKLSSGRTALYYVTYGNKDNTGELYVRVRRPEDSSRHSYINSESVMAIIAYQSGLFGKVIKSVLHLKSENEVSSYLNCANDSYYFDGKITFVCE